MKKEICVTLLAMAVVGCSKSAEDVAPAYVSPYQYKNYDCDQTMNEMFRVNAQANSLAGRLDSSANTDVGTTAVGLVLFWPALFFIGGTTGQESRYAQLRGEYIALEQSAIQKKCDLPESRTFASRSDNSPIVSSYSNSARTSSEQVRSQTNDTANVAKVSGGQLSDAEQQYRRAVSYEQGTEQPRDYAKAVEWYRKAAAQGHRSAIYNLGMMYFNGHGVTQNNGEAVIYFRQAAELKHAKAHFNLGFMMENGHGTAKDPARGLTNYIIASNLGLGEISNNARSNVAAQLSLAQVSEAERQARVWMDEHRR